MTAPPSDRTRVRRLPQRGAYDRAAIDPIHDEADPALPPEIPSPDYLKPEPGQ